MTETYEEKMARVRKLQHQIGWLTRLAEDAQAELEDAQEELDAIELEEKP